MTGEKAGAGMAAWNAAGINTVRNDSEVVCAWLGAADERQTSIGRGTNMTATLAPLMQRAAWKALESHYAKIRELHLRELFAADSKRGERLTAEAAGIYFDYSKNRITGETVRLLLQLAEETGLRSRIGCHLAD